MLSLLILSTSVTSAKSLSLKTANTKDSNKLNLVIDLGDMTKMSDLEVKTKIDKFLTKNVPAKSVLDCSVTVKGTVTVGVASLEISVTVSGTCAEIAKSGTEIANQILAAVKKAVIQM